MIDFRSGDPSGRGWRMRLEAPVATHVATRPADIVELLALADAAAHAGRWVALAVAYDNAGGFPLAWAAEFETVSSAPRQEAPCGESTSPPHGDSGHSPSDSVGRPVTGRQSSLPDFEPSLTQGEFDALAQRAQEHIRAGNTYQVNLTFPMHAPAPADLAAWFEQLHEAQQAPYSAWMDMGRHLVLSFSPELFFERQGNLIRTRPMKGTARRGRWRAEDDLLAAALSGSPKERAENVMIVDLLRNDIGRVAITGSVDVPRLFEIERYPTLWQMSSTIEGRLRPATTLADIFAALFPCGSVTGAPKIRTMEIISELEQTPRGLYTGAIGLIQPGGDCTFSVAIRTIVVDRDTGEATMGVGAGITADSNPAEEYAECLLKARFATSAGKARRGPTLASTRESPPVRLLETMRLEQGDVVRLERHLRRMEDSAHYFGIPWNSARVRSVVDEARIARREGCWRLRLTVDREGAPELTATEHRDAPGALWRVAFANAPVDDSDPFLFNKTTHRPAYEAARRGRPDVDDVLLWNTRGEATESTIANLLVEIDGVKYTPPVSSGLLAGVLRAELLERGDIHERVITRGEVARAPRLWLINSLRGWIEATLVR